MRPNGAPLRSYFAPPLTVNNGKYFIDTTRSIEDQLSTPDLPTLKAERNINVFAKNQTYYLFFVFATERTKQTYQIYVGPNFNPDSVKGVRMNIEQMPMLKPTNTWDIKGVWDVKPNIGNREILDVVVDFRKVQDQKIAEMRPDYSTETCQPSSFCTRGGSTNRCGCDMKKLTALKMDGLDRLGSTFAKVCQETCKAWAVRDLDCPNGGCLGISLTLPDGFEAKNQNVRPVPEEFPADPWSSATTPNMSFMPTVTIPDGDKSKPGDCYYPKVPTNVAADIAKPGKCAVAD